ncbi:hypothetical protein PanWU01x14_181460 [Parasponia andersonii]|uniref:Reverse transcriptase domain-containing protein n=1 Tax=Parasponia andersonii TaxID=3476 RepID=A0A2P5C5Z0_PARAD|nr:hypothetical protein PanWU01x14_181460 [Parasponia andersonii]
MPRGMTELMAKIGTYPRVSTIMTQFLVVDCPSAFNAVLGRLILRELRAVTSIYHLAMKFSTQHRVGEVRGKQYDVRTCYNNSLKLVAKDVAPRTMMVQLQGEASNEMSIEDLDPREIDGEFNIGLIEDLEDLSIDRSSKVLKIGVKLQEPM